VVKKKDEGKREGDSKRGTVRPQGKKSLQNWVGGGGEKFLNRPQKNWEGFNGSAWTHKRRWRAMDDQEGQRRLVNLEAIYPTI